MGTVDFIERDVRIIFHLRRLSVSAEFWYLK